MSSFSELVVVLAHLFLLFGLIAVQRIDRKHNKRKYRKVSFDKTEVFWTEFTREYDRLLPGSIKAKTWTLDDKQSVCMNSLVKKAAANNIFISYIQLKPNKFTIVSVVKSESESVEGICVMIKSLIHITNSKTVKIPKLSQITLDQIRAKLSKEDIIVESIRQTRDSSFVKCRII